MLLIQELYDALKSANVPDDKARAAAREVAKYDKELSDLRSDMNVLRWMVGVNLAISVALLFKVFS
jgi:hypothetical protein